MKNKIVNRVVFAFAIVSLALTMNPSAWAHKASDTSGEHHHGKMGLHKHHHHHKQEAKPANS